MTALLSYPFRLATGGAVATHDDASSDYHMEELAQLIATRPGERELTPTYGLADPAFAGFDQAMLVAQVGLFGPPVKITGVEVTPVSDVERDVVVYFADEEGPL